MALLSRGSVSVTDAGIETKSGLAGRIFDQLKARVNAVLATLPPSGFQQLTSLGNNAQSAPIKKGLADQANDLATELTAPIINSGTVAGPSLTFDFNNGEVQKVTLSGNITSLTLANLQDGALVTFHIIQDGTGNRTITWPAAVKWVGGTAPTLSTVGGRRDVFSFSVDGTNIYETSRSIDVR